VPPIAPVLHDGRWVFASVKGDPPEDCEILVRVRATDGYALVLREADADRHAIPHEGAHAWIECVAGPPFGARALTAALATTAIACRIVAGPAHDHVFVPYDRREDALSALDEVAASPAARPAQRSAVARDDGVPVVTIRDDGIRLGQFLKLAGLVDSGSGVKPLLEYGRVEVNGTREARRGRQLVPGDVVTVDGRSIAVG
jgi:ribosome-associated protein YbcJ (S4-like RNA binding protein)